MTSVTQYHSTQRIMSCLPTFETNTDFTFMAIDVTWLVLVEALFASGNSARVLFTLLVWLTLKKKFRSSVTIDSSMMKMSVR